MRLMSSVKGTSAFLAADRLGGALERPYANRSSVLIEMALPMLTATGQRLA